MKSIKNLEPIMKLKITIEELDKLRDLIGKIEFTYFYSIYNNDWERKEYYDQQAYLDKRVLYYLSVGITIPQLEQKLKQVEKERIEARKRSEEFYQKQRKKQLIEEPLVKSKKKWSIF